MIRLLIILLAASTLAFAQGKSPKKPEPEQKEAPPTSPAAGAKIEKGLDHVENGIKKVGGAAMDGANKALNTVDKTIHKAIE